jgi:gas vesicle protein GvpA/GvpJ/GvpM family
MTMTDTELANPGLADPRYPAERVSLVDLLDRVLAGGVVVTGEITLSIADVDLVVISLRALLTSVSALVEPEAERER